MTRQKPQKRTARRHPTAEQRIEQAAIRKGLVIPCPVCGAVVYDSGTLSRAILGITRIDPQPTHVCR